MSDVKIKLPEYLKTKKGIKIFKFESSLGCFLYLNLHFQGFAWVHKQSNNMHIYNLNLCV